MSEYVGILIWVGVAALISAAGMFKTKIEICGKYEYRESFFWALIVMLPVVWMAGNRENISDTYVYISTFQGMPDTISEIPQYMESTSKDWLFYFCSALIRVCITNKTVVYFTILALFQGIILVIVYQKYSVNYTMSVFLFLASTDYISWMYNGIRQFTAVVITFLGMGLILKKKYIGAILLILLASQFHATALLVLPFIFICQGKAWNKKTLLMIVGAIVIVAGIGEFTGILNSLLADTQYENVVSDWTAWGDDGTNLLRVLVYAVPTGIAFLERKNIQRIDNPVINLCVNMSVVSTCIYVISMFTSGIFIGRLPIYFSLYNYILLPWELDNLYDKGSSGIMKGAMITGYLLFYYYSMHITMGMF